MNSHVHRRTFLVRALGAGLLTLPSARSAGSSQADERLRLALVGDMYNAGHFVSSAHSYDGLDVVALCNADQRKVPETFHAWRERVERGGHAADAGERRAAEYYRRLVESPPAVFSDFRRMFDEMGERIDAVVVSTFDHLHGVICGAAIRAGKHVFSERPLGLTVHDARALRALAARHGAATSIRNPGNASGPFRRAVELIREGRVGTVAAVHVWFPRGGPDHRRPPQGTPPVPDGLDWDAWLGPAAWRPYHPQWMAYAHWREFSNGGLGTFGPHAANLAFMALNVHDLWRPPAESEPPALLRVEAACARNNPLSFPRWEVVRWRVPARAGLPPVTFTWHHGPAPELAPDSRALIEGLLHEHGLPKEELAARRIGGETLLESAGALIVGSDGAIATNSHNTDFLMLPEKRFRDVERTRPRTLPPSRGHYRDWLLACRGGDPPWASFDYAGPLSEFLMLGNLATQFEGPLEYDPASGKIVNHAEADRALGYEYREGWTI